MLILKRNNFLIHYKYKYRCAIGKNGIKRFKKEGDFCTPTGQFNLGPIYYRKDRINKLNTKLNIFPITKNMIWEDNPHNKNYNMLTFNNKKSNETKFSLEYLIISIIIAVCISLIIAYIISSGDESILTDNFWDPIKETNLVD